MTAIHTASFADLDARTGYLLWQLRQRVFVVEQKCFYLDLDGRDLEPETRHLWIEEDGLPVAYLRVLTERATDQPATDQSAGAESATESATGHADGQEELRIGRVLVAEGHRGRGLAERLMKAALGVVDGRPCRLDAQSYLVDWYRRLGFEPSGEEFLEDGIPHVPMTQSSRSLA
ncbi:MAG: GNAT family N-acetyltransferase [Nocardioidaceae bacterium]